MSDTATTENTAQATATPDPKVLALQEAIAESWQLIGKKALAAGVADSSPEMWVFFSAVINNHLRSLYGPMLTVNKVAPAAAPAPTETPAPMEASEPVAAEETK